jgi:hypothetical protein
MNVRLHTMILFDMEFVTGGRGHIVDRARVRGPVVDRIRVRGPI